MKNKYPISAGKKFVYTKEDKKNASIKELKNFGKYYSKFKGLFVWCGVLLVLIGVLSIIGPIITANLIACFTEDNFSVNIVLNYAILIFGLGLISEIINYLLNRFWNFIANNSNYYLTYDLTKRLNSISQSCFDSAESGTFTTRMYGDVQTVCSVPLEIMNYVTECLTQIGFVTYTFSLNVYIGAFMFVYVAAAIGVEFFRINVRQRNHKFIKKLSEHENSFRNENLRGMKDIRGVNATENVINKALEINQNKLSYEYQSQVTMNGLGRLRGTLNTILNLLFILLCVYLFASGQMLLATFVVVFNYRGRILNFANYAVRLKEYFSQCTLSAQRLNEIFDEQKYPTEKFGNVELENINGLLEFKNVTFGYNQNDLVLKNINLKIEPNTITSLVGLSGAGKSTIVSLIDRLYDLNENCGEICLDGVNIKELTKDSLRNNICSISQSPYIYNMTVAENLRLAKSDATDEELIDALVKANIYDYIDSLPNKLDSKLGENGIKLSGGQKQRVAIARAILRNSKIILFDEATSALDNKNQSIIKQTIKELSKTHTIIMVAHRLSTVVDSDNIVFIKDGAVFNQGKHQYLMENCKEYYNLYIEEETD